MSVDRPLILYGTGRSGTSVFQTLLADHPRLAWLSNALNRRPGQPSLGRKIMNRIDTPGVGPAVRSRHHPMECYPFWEHHCPGFTKSFRDLGADDVTERNRRRVRDAMSQVTGTKRDRLLLKITGWPRLGFLAEVFPDARFVHLVRDGRAVANSLLTVGFWRGWQGPEQWRWGPLSATHRSEWERHGRSFVALAGIQWKILMEAADAARDAIDASRVLEITYEDLCAEPLDVCRRVVEFGELEWTPQFEAHVRDYDLRGANDKWRRDLTESQQHVLEDVLGDALARFGYAKA